MTSTGITNAQADANLRSATNLLRVRYGDNDFACLTILRRTGNVGTFSASDGVINNATEQNQVFQAPGNIKVVNQITSCGGIVGPIGGCGQTPGQSFFVVRFAPAFFGTPASEGATWAHEFGHNMGLNHPANMNPPVRIMDLGAGSTTRNSVTLSECRAFVGTLEE